MTNLEETTDSLNKESIDLDVSQEFISSQDQIREKGKNYGDAGEYSSVEEGDSETNTTMTPILDLANRDITHDCSSNYEAGFLVENGKNRNSFNNNITVGVDHWHTAEADNTDGNDNASDSAQPSATAKKARDCDLVNGHNLKQPDSLFICPFCLCKNKACTPSR